ncbi:MAG: 2TM domain-containing protein [Elainellaceae cyanobacterium]
MPETYNEDAVQKILRLAMIRQGQDVALPRSQLVEIAEDLGISESTLEAAEEEWQVQQEEQQARESFDVYRHQRLRQGIIRFFIVNGGLVLLNVAVAHRVDWSVYPVLFWGLAIALQAWQTWRTEGEDYDRALRRWRLRQQIGESFKAISERLKFSGLDDGEQASEESEGFAQSSSTSSPDLSVNSTQSSSAAQPSSRDDIANGFNGAKKMKSATVSDSSQPLNPSAAIANGKPEKIADLTLDAARFAPTDPAADPAADPATNSSTLDGAALDSSLIDVPAIDPAPDSDSAPAPDSEHE